MNKRNLCDLDVCEWKSSEFWGFNEISSFNGFFYSDIALKRIWSQFVLWFVIVKLFLISMPIEYFLQTNQMQFGFFSVWFPFLESFFVLIFLSRFWTFISFLISNLFEYFTCFTLNCNKNLNLCTLHGRIVISNCFHNAFIARICFNLISTKT